MCGGHWRAEAEEAFKRLSEAYDCLSTEPSQRDYLSTLRRVASGGQTRGSSGRAPSAAPSAPPRRYKRKRKPEASGTSDAEPVPTRPRRRTPEEVWRQFQEEEEAMARREFLAKGFERVYEPRRRHDNARNSESTPMAQSMETAQADIMVSDLDARAKSWASWTRPRTNGGSSSPAPTEAPETTRPSLVVCCLLCRRKFASTTMLERHEAHSKLHATNLEEKRRCEERGESPVDG